MARGRYPREDSDADFRRGDDDRGATGYSSEYGDQSARHGWHDVDNSPTYDAEPDYYAMPREGGVAGDADEYPHRGEGFRPGPLVPRDADDAGMLAPYQEQDTPAPTIIPGTGKVLATLYIPRRERSLTARLTVVTLSVCILVTGLFSVTSLGASADSGLSSFQALSGAVLWHNQVSYHWYVAQPGDTIESIAAKEHVQIGGIYQLNKMYAGQDVKLGVEYKIPDDPFYGKNYRPPSLVQTGNGTTVYGSSPWNSIAGNPMPEQPCAPDGQGNPLGYKLVSPNPGAHWVRGFTGTHNGDDIAALFGNPIRAAQDGQVIWAGWDFYGLGYSIKINNCGHIATMYGHMSQLLVKAKQNVHAGDVIGLEGSTGNSTGPHLHFMVEWNNEPVDPMPYFAYSVCRITATC